MTQKRTPGIAKAKEYTTLRERMLAGVPTELDIAAIATQYGLISTRQRSTMRFLDAIVTDPNIAMMVPRYVARGSKHGKPQHDALKAAGMDFYTVRNPLSGVVGEGKATSKSYALPAPMVEHIRQLDELYQAPGKMEQFMKPINQWQGVWKAYAVMSPGFHMRNMFSNWANNWLGGVSNPLRYKEAFTLQVGDASRTPKNVRTALNQIEGKSADKAADMRFKIKKGEMKGQEITGDEMLQEIHKHNVMGGFLRNDFDDAIEGTVTSKLLKNEDLARKSGLASDVGSTRADEDAFDFARDVLTHSDETGDVLRRRVENMAKGSAPWLQFNRNVGKAVENNARMAHFIDRVIKGDSFEDAAWSVRRFLFDYCFDEETEILTDNGWQRWDTITADEQALAFDMENDCLEWTDIKGVHITEYEGEINHWKSNMALLNEPSRFDAVMTDRHKWIAYGDSENHDRYSLQSAGKLTAHKLKVCSENYLAPEEKAYTDTFVELIGWALTEGNYSCQGKSLQIYQSKIANPQHMERLRDCWTRIQDEEEGTFSEYLLREEICSFYIGKQLAHKIRDMFPDKQLTVPFLKKLTHPQLELLYEVLIISDGYTKGDMEFFVQKGDAFAGAFQVLCFMLGKRSNCRKRNNKGHICNEISVYTAKDVYRDGLTRTRENYQGKIWCISTKHKTLVARRNGTVYLSGNTELTDFERHAMRFIMPFYTWSRYNVVLQLQSIITQPHRYARIPKAINAVEFPTKEDWQNIPTPDYFQELHAVRLPWRHTGQPVYMNPNLPFQDLNRIPLLNMKDTIGMMSPAIKTWFEIGPKKGFSFFLDRDIEEYPGQPSEFSPLSKKMEYAVRTLAPTYGKIQRLREKADRDQLMEQLMTEFAGLKLMGVDVDQQLANDNYRRRRITRSLKERWAERIARMADVEE